VVALDGDRAGGAHDVGVGAERDGPAFGGHERRDLGEGVQIDDVLLVVVGDDVVRLPVVGVDPDAGRVDVAERRVERRLRRLPGGDPDHPGLIADRVHVDLGVVRLELHADVAHAAHGPRDLRHRLALLLERFEIVVLELHGDGRVVPVRKDARDEASRPLKELDARVVLVQEPAHHVRDLLLRVLSVLGLGEGHADESHVRPVVRARHRAPRVLGRPSFVRTRVTSPLGSSRASIFAISWIRRSPRAARCPART
jgi:hypothetical protein